MSKAYCLIGGSLALLLLANGAAAQTAVLAAGMNKQGQLGIGSTIDAHTLTMVEGISDFETIVAGPHHTLAIRGDGTLWSWGNNFNKQLGVGAMPVETHVPLHVTSLSDVASAAVSPILSYASTGVGAAYWWGGAWNDSGIPEPYTPLQGMVELKIGVRHSIVRTLNGQLFVSGDNSVGQFGNGTLEDVSGWHAVPGIENAVFIAVGKFHNLALLSDGTLRAWGLNNLGQIGNGTTVNALSPTAVEALSDIVQIAVSGDHNLALRADGTLFAWGKNSSGQVGDGTTNDALTPMQISSEVAFTAIAAGGYHSLAIDVNGQLWAWGSNMYGQLGDGTQIDALVPMQVPGISNAQSISAGIFQTYVVNGPTAKCLADIAPGQGDGAVDQLDLELLLSGWGACPVKSPCAGDISPAEGDGAVDVDDLLMLINNWGICD